MAAQKTYKHLSIDERTEIEQFLNNPDIQLKTIALSLQRADKSIREEIRRNRTLVVRKNQRNKCGKQNECSRTRLCTHCVSGVCKYCRHDNCNNLCDWFTENPVCPRTTRFPYVCNGCPDLESCKLPRVFYRASAAQDNYERNVSEWKEGPKADEQEMAEIVKAVKKGVENGHSIDVIVNQNKLPVSTSTVYRYVHTRCIAGVVTVDLKRAVRYKKQKKSKLTPLNYDFLEGRRWEDFLDRIASDPSLPVWEMDTVIGKKGSDEKCVLSLLFRNSNLQLFFLLESKTMLEVQRVFDGIKSYLGSDLFVRTFPVILTDNGSEFHDPLNLETDPVTGEKLCWIYFCLPRHSEQKAKCEKNHEHFREMCPKGISMNSLSRITVRYVSNMVNNYPRKSLQYNTPLEVSRLFLNEKVFELNRLNTLPSDQVKLKPIIH